DNNGQHDLTVDLDQDLTGLNSASFDNGSNTVKLSTDNNGALQVDDGSGNPVQITNVASGMTDANGDGVSDLADAEKTNAASMGDLQGITLSDNGGGFGLK